MMKNGSPPEAAPFAPNYEAYAWLPDKLVFTFAPYQVAAYAAGPQVIEIPMKDIKPLMRPDPLAPLASFDCDKAAVKIEMAICADWKFARADRLLSDAYQESLRSAADAAQKEKIKLVQRTWLMRERDDMCDQFTADALNACLSEKIDDRIKALKTP